MKIFIVGSGKLANAILTSKVLFQAWEITKWETKYQSLYEKGILIHAGSGRQLNECFSFCSKTKSVFVELSTGLKTENMNPDFPLIICPNTSILVLKTLSIINKNGKCFEDYEISITESHQSTKKTESGTAFVLANSLKLPHNRIVSIREPKIQQNELGIPAKYLNKHAHHKIKIKDGNDEVFIETKVMGHNSYVNGVKKIIETVLIHNFENKKYTVLDLIDNNML